MLGKLLIALLMLALAWMTFKFLREREERLRDRIERPPARTEKKTEAADEAITLKKDPKTGVYEPSDD